MEIEKRYEINGEIPMDLVKSKQYIEQVYSSIADKVKAVPDVRIRKSVQDDNVSYTHTVKYKTDDKHSRIELEQNISEEIYNQIFNLINKKPLRKNRYIIPINDKLVAEIDEFLDKNMIIIEVEFPDEETMNEFSNSQKPSYFGKEITKQKFSSSFIFSQLNTDVDIKFY